MRTKIKICGLFRDCDMDYVNAAKPDYIGFILNYPKSRRNVTAREAAQLRQKLLPEIRCVGVFVDQSMETVCAAAEEIGLDVIQLHGREDDGTITALQERTGLPVWKAFQIKTKEDLLAALACPADEILLDGGFGAGEMFDWPLLSGFPRPFILAGGLTPENIPEALRLMNLKMLDISSGVETDGVKDPEKIIAAVRKAHAK